MGAWRAPRNSGQLVRLQRRECPTDTARAKAAGGGGGGTGIDVGGVPQRTRTAGGAVCVGPSASAMSYTCARDRCLNLDKICSLRSIIADHAFSMFSAGYATAVCGIYAMLYSNRRSRSSHKLLVVIICGSKTCQAYFK